MKCKVISKCVLAVEPGSIVEVDERQFEAARMFLAPEDKDAQAPVKEKRTKKK